LRYLQTHRLRHLLRSSSREKTSQEQNLKVSKRRPLCLRKKLSGRAFEPRLPEQTEQATLPETNDERYENPIAVISTSLSEQTGQPTSPEQAAPVQPEQEQLNVAQAAAEKKFFLGPQPEASVARQDALPASYDDNRLVLLARDPYWLYAYWDFDAARFSNGHSRLAGDEHHFVLRVFDVTYLEFNGQNAWSTADIELAPFATNWYIPVPQAETAYLWKLATVQKTDNSLP